MICLNRLAMRFAAIGLFSLYSIGSLSSEHFYNEKIGPFYLDMRADELKSKTKCEFVEGEAFEHPGTGNYNQVWSSEDCSLIVRLYLDDKDGVQRLEEITIYSGSNFASESGVKLGDSVEKVMGIYRDKIDQDASDLSLIVLGSVYGGMFFSIEDEKVVKIHIGAIAE